MSAATKSVAFTTADGGVGCLLGRLAVGRMLRIRQSLLIALHDEMGHARRHDRGHALSSRASGVCALEILYRRVPGGLRPRLIADALGEAERGLIDLSGLWIARRRGRIVGALLTQPLAGRAAAVWAPEVDPSWRRSAIAVALVRAALADLQTPRVHHRAGAARRVGAPPRRRGPDARGDAPGHRADLP